MVLLFCLVLFYKPQTHVNKILFKCLNPYRSCTRIVNIINPFFPQPDHKLISALPFSVSQYELAMPPKVRPLKLECGLLRIHILWSISVQCTWLEWPLLRKSERDLPYHQTPQAMATERKPHSELPHSSSYSRNSLEIPS